MPRTPRPPTKDHWRRRHHRRSSGWDIGGQNQAMICLPLYRGTRGREIISLSRYEYVRVPIIAYCVTIITIRRVDDHCSQRGACAVCICPRALESEELAQQPTLKRSKSVHDLPSSVPWKGWTRDHLTLKVRGRIQSCNDDDQTAYWQ